VSREQIIHFTPVPDNGLAALAIALPYLKENGRKQDYHAASPLCRLGFWHLGNFDRFYSLPRFQPGSRWSKSWAVSTMLDLSIEAAVTLEHLRLASAKRLASDALNIAETGIKGADGLAPLPAWSFWRRSLQAIARERAILLCRIWTALMLKRTIRLVESTDERDWPDFNLNKAEVLATLRCLHDQTVDGPPSAGS
jgi:hypothetical protein